MSKSQLSKSDRRWVLERRRVRKIERANRRRAGKDAQDARRYPKRLAAGKIKKHR